MPGLISSQVTKETVTPCHLPPWWSLNWASPREWSHRDKVDRVMVYISKVPSHQRCSRTRSRAHQSGSQGAIPGGILARYQGSEVPPWVWTSPQRLFSGARTTPTRTWALLPCGELESLSRGKLFYCTLPAVRVSLKRRGSARNASWTSCCWGIPWGTMGAPPRYYPQLGGAHRQHGVVVRHLFYTWTPPCLVCRAQGCYSKGCWCWDVHIPNQCAHFCLCYVHSRSLVDWALDWKEDLGCYLSPTSASVSNQCHLRVAAFAVVAFSRWEATDFLKLRQELDIPAQGRRFQLTFLYFIWRNCRKKIKSPRPSLLWSKLFCEHCVNPPIQLTVLTKDSFKVQSRILLQSHLRTTKVLDQHL